MGSMELLENLRVAEAELIALGKGHLASIRHDAEKLLPPVNKNQSDHGQSFSIPDRAKGASHLAGMISRERDITPKDYGKQVKVSVTAKKEWDVPVAGMGRPEKKTDQQTAEVGFDGDNFEVAVDGHCLWSEKNGETQYIPGSLQLVVERLIAVSALLREESNPRVIERVEKAQQAIREQLSELGLFPWSA